MSWFPWNSPIRRSDDRIIILELMSTRICWPNGYFNIGIDPISPCWSIRLQWGRREFLNDTPPIWAIAYTDGVCLIWDFPRASNNYRYVWIPRFERYRDPRIY